MNSKKRLKSYKNSEHYKTVKQAEAKLNKKIQKTSRQINNKEYQANKHQEGNLGLFGLFKGRVPWGCFIILFKVAVVIVVLVFLSVRNSIYLDPFKAHVSEYSIVSGLKNAAMTNPDLTEPYIKGKIITVNKKENRIDDIYFYLPEELRATKPEDVGTIVWLECGEDEVGHYTDGKTATVNICKVTIIDKSIPTIVGEMSFTGSDPPELKKRRDSGSGSIPTEQIVNFLQGLPKK